MLGIELSPWTEVANVLGQRLVLEWDLVPWILVHVRSPAQMGRHLHAMQVTSSLCANP